MDTKTKAAPAPDGSVPQPVTEEELMNALHAAPAEGGLFSVQNAARALLRDFTITRKPKLTP